MGDERTFRIVRSWDERHRPPKSEDPDAPLEARIDISPSDEFSDTERRYVGHSTGHPIGYVLMVSTLLLLFMVGVLGWWPSLAAFAIGALIVRLTKTPGDATKIAAVKAAKARIRERAETARQEAMRDLRAWMALDGVGFERAVAAIYRDQGFDVQFTPRTNDQGIDLVLRRNGTTTIVQRKAWASNVGVGAVRELLGVRVSWPQANEAILVTLFGCSSAARAFAEQNGVKLYSVARDFLETEYRPAGAADGC
jgi:restriction system protein